MSQGVIDAFYLPEHLARGIETTVQRFGPAHDSVALRLPVVTPSEIERWIAGLRGARAELLANRPIAEILRSLDRVASRLLDASDPARARLIEALSRMGRFSAPMIERALDDAFQPIARRGLEKWVGSELGSPDVLDRPAPTREGVMRRAIGPEWMLQIYAGNVPSVPVWPMVSALVLKAALLAKTAAGEPILAPTLARTIAEVDPSLGRCLAVVWWKGGASELDEAALSEAPAVLAFGSDPALTSISRQIHPGASVVMHGPKVSLGYVGRKALTRTALPRLAARAALDVSLYDQHGCRSPHAFYVERGGAVTPAEFAAALGKALDQASETLPRRDPSSMESAALQLYRAQARFDAAAGSSTGVLTSESSTTWTVVCESGARFEPGPARRAVRVHAIGDVEEFAAVVGPEVRYVEAIALEEAGSRRAQLAARFADLGIPAIASVGSLQRPSPLGTHGGVKRLLPFVTWSTMEPAAPTPRASRESTARSRTRTRPQARRRARPRSS